MSLLFQQMKKFSNALRRHSFTKAKMKYRECFLKNLNISLTLALWFYLSIVQVGKFIIYYFPFCLITVLQKIIVTDTRSDKVSIKTRPTQQSQECTWMQLLKGHFPPGGIFREERHFLMFEDQLAESGRQKTKENIIPCGKFRLEENDLNSLK